METVVQVRGIDGTVWDIAGDRAGEQGVYLAPEVSGLLDPEFEFVTQSVADLHGSKLVASRIPERHLIFSVWIEGRGNDKPAGTPWEVVDSRWRKAWSPTRPTEIRVKSEMSGMRRLNAYLSSITVDTETDPRHRLYTKVDMDVVAYDPFWYGDEEVFDLTLNESQSSTSFPWRGSVTIPLTNPTDMELWPVWVLEGPGRYQVPDVLFTDDGQVRENRVVTTPLLGNGQHVTVDTAPGARQFTASDGSPVWNQMNGVRFRNSVPPYTRLVKWTVSGTRQGARVQVRLKRRYTRAWGLD